MTTLPAMFASSGILLAILSLPPWFEKIPPNPFYGFRIAPALDDPAVWYATNRYAAVRMFAAGLLTTAAAVGLYFVPGLTIDAYARACLAVFAAVFAPGMIQSYRYMRGLARGKTPP